MSGKITAPFTPEQVDALNRWQECQHVHPFTCGAVGCRELLLATPNGWRCPNPDCSYTQDWAHDFMALGLPPNPLAAMSIQRPESSAELAQRLESDDLQER